MDIRWKKFRYGTEQRNPSWSFFGSVLCPTAALILFAAAYFRGNGFFLVAGLWFLVFSAVSLVHLYRIMGNEKENLFPVGLFDRTLPDLVLSLLLAALCFFLFGWGWNGNSGWWTYSYVVSQTLSKYWLPLIFLIGFLKVVFLTGTIVLFLVILYMSVARHLSREKLRKKLFFRQVRERAFKKIRHVRKEWNERRLIRIERGKTVRIFRRRQLWFLGIQGAIFLLGCLWVGAVYYNMEEVMTIAAAAGAVFFLFDLRSVLKTSSEVGVLLDEIAHIAEDRRTQSSPALGRYSLFRKAEEALFRIRENQRESMEKRLQSERMKVDLITNVSHDLKTPLTSMIGCIDLLKQVEDLPQEAQDYVSLLSAKAERLGGMIQDVFDMAKATSGGQDLVMERLDMARLIRQTMADMQDRIDASGLHYRIKIEDRELPFLGDSKKMYRVYQNLFENTLKYSMPGSRVYVEVSQSGGEIRTSIKNTSDCEMDFSAEEIMERFTRGDKSRSTEGNGLGLAIARSFTEACGGSFELTLDGDLFRVDTVFAVMEAQAGEAE